MNPDTDLLQIATTHRNCDFDGLASVVAATLLYPGAVPIVPTAVNANVKAFLSFHKDMLDVRAPDDVDLQKVGRLIVLDTARWDRLDRMSPLENKPGLEIVLWDHHSDVGTIEAASAVTEVIGATITLLIRELRRLKIPLTPMMATLFLCGIYEDTGNLTFTSTTAEDAYAAGWLLEQKADLHVLERFLRPAYGQKQKEVLFQMLQKAERGTARGHSISICSIDVTGHVGSLAIVVRMYKDIVNVDAAIGIFRDTAGDRCIVIGRSQPDTIDMGVLMRALGGGGHAGAASALVKGARPEAIEEMILSLIYGNQQASVQMSDLMSFPVVAVTPDTSMDQVAKVLRSRGFTGLPVMDDGRLVGMISRRDFRKVRKESQLKAPVKAFMATKIITIEPGASPLQAAHLMVKHDIGRLPVVENDRVIGIVTRSDSMTYFYDLLPD
ncbi:MAG: CBS domain-containing protein [Desulfobacterales bacterium]